MHKVDFPDELRRIHRELHKLSRYNDLERMVVSRDKWEDLLAHLRIVLEENLGPKSKFSKKLLRLSGASPRPLYGAPAPDSVNEVCDLICEVLRYLGDEVLDTQGKQSTKDPYVDLKRLHELRTGGHPNWDLSRLVQLCLELNTAHENECHITTAILVRAITDHVSPIFGQKSFSEIANNYSGSKSFKKSMQHLQLSLRNIADSCLHQPVRRKESLPNATQVNFSADLDVLLAETSRLCSEARVVLN